MPGFHLLTNFFVTVTLLPFVRGHCAVMANMNSKVIRAPSPIETTALNRGSQSQTAVSEAEAEGSSQPTREVQFADACVQADFECSSMSDFSLDESDWGSPEPDDRVSQCPASPTQEVCKSDRPLWHSRPEQLALKDSETGNTDSEAVEVLLDPHRPDDVDTTHHDPPGSSCGKLSQNEPTVESDDEYLWDQVEDIGFDDIDTIDPSEVATTEQICHEARTSPITQSHRASSAIITPPSSPSRESTLYDHSNATQSSRGSNPPEQEKLKGQEPVHNPDFHSAEPSSIYRRAFSKLCYIPQRLQDMQRKLQASELRQAELSEKQAALESRLEWYVIGYIDLCICELCRFTRSLRAEKEVLKKKLSKR